MRKGENMKASDILKADSTAFMTVGVNALKKLIKELAAQTYRANQLDKRLDLAQKLILEQEKEIRDLQQTTVRIRTISSIEMDI